MRGCRAASVSRVRCASSLTRSQEITQATLDSRARQGGRRHQVGIEPKPAASRPPSLCSPLQPQTFLRTGRMPRSHSLIISLPCNPQFFNESVFATWTKDVTGRNLRQVGNRVLFLPKIPRIQFSICCLLLVIFKTEGMGC